MVPEPAVTEALTEYRAVEALRGVGRGLSVERI